MAVKKSPRWVVWLLAACAAAALGIAAFTSLVRLPYAPAVVQIPEAGISFVPPAGYEREKVTFGAVFSYSGMAAKGVSCRFNLAKNPALPGEKIDLATAEKMVGVLQKLHRSYEKTATGTLTVAGEPAAFVSGTLTIYGGEKMHVKQVFMTHKGQVYNFTFSADPPAFNEQVVAFDQMLTTIKWL